MTAVKLAVAAVAVSAALFGVAATGQEPDITPSLVVTGHVSPGERVSAWNLTRLDETDAGIGITRRCDDTFADAATGAFTLTLFEGGPCAPGDGDELLVSRGGTVPLYHRITYRAGRSCDLSAYEFPQYAGVGETAPRLGYGDGATAYPPDLTNGVLEVTDCVDVTPPEPTPTATPTPTPDVCHEALYRNGQLEPGPERECP